MRMHPASNLQLTALIAIAAAIAAVATSTTAVHAKPAAVASALREAPQDRTLPPQSQVEQVMGFVHGKRNELGKHVYASTDWDNERIILAADPEARASLSKYDGSDVGGLRVDVISAVVTPLEFETAILAIDMETFPNSDRVGSFSLPADTSTIDVKIIDLDELTQWSDQNLPTTWHESVVSQCGSSATARASPCRGATSEARGRAVVSSGTTLTPPIRFLAAPASRF